LLPPLGFIIVTVSIVLGFLRSSTSMEAGWSPSRGLAFLNVKERKDVES
jgi:hypothetical protein